jgi:Tol biopolymer transport system component
MKSDGSAVAYTVTEDGKRVVYSADTQSGAVSRICSACGYPWEWTPDGRALVVDVIYDDHTYVPARFAFGWLDVHSSQVAMLPTGRYAAEARVHPQGRMVAFHVITSAENRQVFLAPLRSGAGGKIELPPEREWIAITDGTSIDRNPAWSPEGNLLYYQSERDGWRCIWARRIRPSGEPDGPAFPVYHSHSARLSMKLAGHESATGLAVARDKLVFSQGERTGVLWLARAAERSSF